MSKGLWTPHETVKQALNMSLSDDVLDNEVIGYQLQAQTFVENFCHRQFDGELTTTEFQDGSLQDRINLRNFPIRAISQFREDTSKNFDSAELDFDTTDFTTIPEQGIIFLRGRLFKEGNYTIKTIYNGGYIVEQTVIPSTVGADTILSTLDLSTFSSSTFNEEFYAFLHTTGTDATPGIVTLIGTDAADAAQTEVLTPNATKLIDGNTTISYSKLKWKTITQLDAANLSSANVRVTAVSFPTDLQLAIRILTTHYVRIDERFSIGTSSRSIGGRSETFDDAEIPKQVTQIISKYVNAIPM